MSCCGDSTSSTEPTWEPGARLSCFAQTCPCHCPGRGWYQPQSPCEAPKPSSPSVCPGPAELGAGRVQAHVPIKPRQTGAPGFSKQSSWKPAHDGHGRPEARVLSSACLNLIAGRFHPGRDGREQSRVLEVNLIPAFLKLCSWSHSAVGHNSISHSGQRQWGQLCPSVLIVPGRPGLLLSDVNRQISNVS